MSDTNPSARQVILGSPVVVQKLFHTLGRPPQLAFSTFRPLARCSSSAQPRSFAVKQLTGCLGKPKESPTIEAIYAVVGVLGTLVAPEAQMQPGSD